MRQAVAVENDQKGSFEANRRYGNKPIPAEVEEFWGMPFLSALRKAETQIAKTMIARNNTASMDTKRNHAPKHKATKTQYTA